MPRTILPHQFFRIDFDMMLGQANEQEEKDPVNKGEYAIVQSMHRYFCENVLPAIIRDDWVYDAASRFASEYAIECFRYLRLGADQIYQRQVRLLEIKEQVLDFIARVKAAGCMIPLSGSTRLSHLSDFLSVIDVGKLPDEMRREATSLREDAQDLEPLLLDATLDALRATYERLLPRIMYVVRRTIKTNQGLRRKKSDQDLIAISECLSWYDAHVSNTHPLYPVLGNLQPFYKVARNVGSHHRGLEWDENNDQIILRDKTTTLTMPLYEFQQKYRHMVYLCELGTRGILSAFCEREQGSVSNWLVKEYEKTFPDNFPVEEPETEVIPYPT